MREIQPIQTQIKRRENRNSISQKDQDLRQIKTLNQILRMITTQKIIKRDTINQVDMEANQTHKSKYKDSLISMDCMITVMIQNKTQEAQQARTTSSKKERQTQVRSISRRREAHSTMITLRYMIIMAVFKALTLIEKEDQEEIQANQEINIKETTVTIVGSLMMSGFIRSNMR